MDIQIVAVEEDVADGLAQRGAAGVAADDDLPALFAQPVGEQFDLRRFTGAVAAVDGDKHG